MLIDFTFPMKRLWLRILLWPLFSLLVLAILLPAAIADDNPTPAAATVPTGAPAAPATKNDEHVLVRDITTIEGVRENPLVGYGIVVGLNGTGDRRQTLFTTQTLANIMQRMGVQIPADQIRVNNIAAVFITASLPAFARPGMKLDITVSSIGDAKSLQGGVLLLTPLHGPDGEVYAAAQGPLTLGGYSVGGGAGNSKQVNHTTVGKVANGAMVERDTAIDLGQFKTVSFMLRDSDFTASTDVAAAINKDFGREVAVALDSRRIDVNVAQAAVPTVPELISRVQNLAIIFHPPAKVVIDERTGTIVMGGNVKLSAVSVLHGNLNIEVATTFQVSQPEPFSKNGETEVVPQVSLQAGQTSVGKIQLGEGASVEDLVNGLHAVGATASDVVAILQAIKAAGGLRAELEVL
jgi:flagellar P-ring protein precursor FlgI